MFTVLCSVYFDLRPLRATDILRIAQHYCLTRAITISDDAAVKNRLSECLETILNKAQEPPKSKKVQHSNAKNAVLFEAINLIIHMDSDPNLLVRACNQLGQFLQHRETNLRYECCHKQNLSVVILFCFCFCLHHLYTFGIQMSDDQRQC